MLAQYSYVLLNQRILVCCHLEKKYKNANLVAITSIKERESKFVEKLAKKTKRFFFVLVAMGAIGSFKVEEESLLYEFLTKTEAITTPWGVIYFIDDPSDWVKGHEQCHLDRVEDIGPILFYLDYLTDGACEEEIRCGADPDTHPACVYYDPLQK